MPNKSISTEQLAKMFLAGAKNLEAHKAFINELNVFPVPDGDTGTNMTLTIMSAAKEVVALENPPMKELAKAISSGSLRGARGNSGVILSQLFRGFTKIVRDEKEIDAFVLAAACNKARDTAYKAVMKPKEGTILTVASGIAEKATQMAEITDDLDEIFPAVLEYGQKVLEKTPDLLPVLKEAGVVDSGGQGLMEILRGAYDAFLGKEIDYSTIVPGSTNVKLSSTTSPDASDIKFGYCTEFIINVENDFSESKESDFKSYLTSIGDSIVCVADDDIVKVHVHTNDPGLAIQKALTYGSLSRLKIDNMREEHEEKIKMEALKDLKSVPRKAIGFIAVSIGTGMNNIFKDLGVDYIIEGGQTMNPSTDDMLTAIDKVNADTVFILPNNKNIILAANQARDLTKDKDIVVIPSKTVPQGITAIISYSAEVSASKNMEIMNSEIKNVKTGQVTYAVRDTHIDDKEIHEGDIMGIGDSGMLAVGQDIETVALATIEEMINDDSELISIYYGEDVSEADATKLNETLESKYKNMDIDLQFGGQPIYYYVMSVE
ncbi:MAG: DAK2 domain-containing protein [Suipraeoptans sp.]